MTSWKGKSVEDSRTLKLQSCWDRQEYWEHSRRSEETFCYSDCNENSATYDGGDNTE